MGYDGSLPSYVLHSRNFIELDTYNCEVVISLCYSKNESISNLRNYNRSYSDVIIMMTDIH